MKIAFYTLGCKVNQYETDVLKEKAEDLGFELMDFGDKNENIDIYVINSCSVTNMSERKTRQMVSRARSQNKDAMVILMGCGVENIRNDKSLFESKADILIGNEDKLNLFKIIEEYIIKEKNKIDKKRKQIKEKQQEYIGLNKTKLKLIKVGEIEKVKQYRNEYSLKRGYDVREAVKIEDGCNNFCTYCIIPYVRGRVRSRNKEEIINEIKRLVENGVKEVVIVGIEIASYGKDLKNENLLELLININMIEGLERIRIGSLLPSFLTRENILNLAKINKICPHFHISMQSADDRILRAMNRRYTSENLKEIVKNLKENFSNPYIAADIIVGFPGETNHMFENTYIALKKLQLTELHVFKFSKRKYTVAETMENQIEESSKESRSECLLKLSLENKERYLKENVGKVHEVIFESYKNKKNIGYTKNYMKVIVKGNNNLCGTKQDVEITFLDKEGLIGKLKKEV